MTFANSKHLRRWGVILLLLLVSCESDTAKAERLRGEAVRACFPVTIARSSGDWSHVTDQRRAECDVAERNLRKFLDGR